jgi:hypothetical protein
MSLTEDLRNQGFDLIDGPVRSVKVLQMYRKRAFDEVEFYYEHITHAFKMANVPVSLPSQALNVTSSDTDEYGFNIGVSLANEILSSIGFGELNLEGKVKAGKTLTISFNDTRCEEVPVGSLDIALATADFIHENKVLLTEANRNNLIVITGLLFAKEFKMELVMNYAITPEIKAKIEGILDGNISASFEGQSKVVLIANKGVEFPVAVKAHRLDFDKGKFKKSILITDNRRFF